MDELEATEVLKLKRTIVERTQQLRERRAAILAGAALTEEEAAAPAVVSDETPVPTELEDDLKLYWQKAIMQGVLLHDVEALQSENVPNELDLRILAHLADIQLAVKTHTDDALDERDTVHLVLVFRPNEFLEPGFETLECAFDRVKGQLKSTSGLEIKWRDGKAPTIEGSLSFFDMFAKVGDFAQQAEEKAAVTKELLALIEEVLLHNSISQVLGADDEEDDFDYYPDEEDEDEDELTTSLAKQALASSLLVRCIVEDEASRTIQTAYREYRRPTETPPPPDFVHAPAHPKAAYEQLEKLPVMLNRHLMSGTPSSSLGTNLFPYAELILAKELLFPEAPAQPPPKREKPNLSDKLEIRVRKAVDVVRKAEYELILTELRAQGVPDADTEVTMTGSSDPYLGFSVLRADGEYSDLYRWQLDACTAPVRNSKNPTWSTPIKLWIPHGAAASLHAASKIYQDPDLYPTYHNQTSFWEKVRRRLTTSEQALLEQPVVDVLVRLFDRDIESEADEELATATLQLGADRTGTVAQAPMGGLGKFASQPASTLSFCWELVPYLPPPAAILTLRAIEILNFVPRVKPKPAYEQRGYAASTASSKVLATTRALDAAPRLTGPYVRFALLEVGSDMVQMVQTAPLTTTLGLELFLPKGSRRPALLQVQLFDSNEPEDFEPPWLKPPVPKTAPRKGGAKSGERKGQGTQDGARSGERKGPRQAGASLPKPISTADLRLVEGPGGRPEVVEAQLPYYVEGRKLKIVTVRRGDLVGAQHEVHSVYDPRVLMKADDLQVYELMRHYMPYDLADAYFPVRRELQS
ncbi:hypothetical protein Ctob_005920 [Chrysochromulina tobinii]|uniref:C2 domain-containing protein n=1 Tax=Chrysochromulina tobinii TaxID=1460289 RepID=A0A0M0JSM3_9EUKA|nr:hypothetical protein Ctob_005920 [Chrysochromulina tobinii]|eukprot:KOO29485.1 hypothetical protein Ctob_005920 [Chrysochromulina sp. CCMP291]